jgi:molybdate transport system substrate-binding protein
VRTVGLLVLLLALFAGCSMKKEAPADLTSPADVTPPAPLMIAAASDLQIVLPVVVERFLADNPGQYVEVTYGASGQLAEQVKARGPFDLFLAANESYMKELAEQGYVKAASIRPYAIGSLVLAVHKDSGGSVASLADVARPEVKKIAIANPDFAPYGAAAKQALQRAELWERVEQKVVHAGTVRQALQFIQTGNCEVGLVSRATANAPEVRLIEVDPTLYDPIVQSLGIVAECRDEAFAARFVKFLLGEKGRSILEAHGFKMPPSAPAAP